MEDKNEGIKINAYIGSISVTAMGKRSIRLDIPEDQTIHLMAAMTLHGKFVEVTIREVKETE